MKMVVYAVITLFYAVPEKSAKDFDSRNRLFDRELHGIIRRSRSTLSKFTLLITLLFWACVRKSYPMRQICWRPPGALLAAPETLPW